jgi:hypothetical protein
MPGYFRGKCSLSTTKEMVLRLSYVQYWGHHDLRVSSYSYVPDAPSFFAVETREPLSDNSDFSADEFVAKMEAGYFEGTLNDEIRKLSREQLLEVANLHMKLRKATIDQAFLKGDRENSK